MTPSPTAVHRIGIVAGDTAAARLEANAVYSLLTAAGNWAEPARLGALVDFDVVVLSSSRLWPAASREFRGPLVVYDAELLGGRVARPFRDVVRWPAPTGSGAPALESTGARVARVGAAGAARALELTPTLRYALPEHASIDLQQPAGFWRLAATVQEDVAAVLGCERSYFADPWPDGAAGAAAFTCDLDDLGRGGGRVALPDGVALTLFCCADDLAHLPDVRGAVEIAAHGDVHLPFLDGRDNARRIAAMLDGFRAEGRVPLGFSPPMLTYSSPLEELTDRFAYVRLGYMEPEMLFFPAPAGAALRLPVSYYTDYLLRYVDPARFADFLVGYLGWTAACGTLAVLCFHPVQFPHAADTVAARRPPGLWCATLADVSAWWRRRQAAFTAARRGETTSGVAGEVTAWPERLERLARRAPAPAEPAPGIELQTRPSPRGPVHVVVNDAPAARADVEIAVALPQRHLAWLPGRLAERLCRRQLRIWNKSGFHAALYSTLRYRPALTIDRRAGCVRLTLPVVAAREPLVIGLAARPRLRGMAGALGRRVRDLWRWAAPRVPAVRSDARG
jgi:hypothetical protein